MREGGLKDALQWRDGPYRGTDTYKKDKKDKKNDG